MQKVEVNFLKSEKSWDGKGIDLNKELVSHPVSTFFFKWKENPNKVLVVDRSINISNGKKIVFLYKQGILLGEIVSEFNHTYILRGKQKIFFTPDVVVWGVVTYIISKA